MEESWESAPRTTILTGASAGGVVNGEGRAPGNTFVSVQTLGLGAADPPEGYGVLNLLAAARAAAKASGQDLWTFTDGPLGELVPSASFEPPEFRHARKIMGLLAVRHAPTPYQPLLDLLMGIEYGGSQTQHSRERRWAVEALETLFAGDDPTAAAWVGTYPFKLLSAVTGSMPPPQVQWLGRILNVTLVAPVRWGDLMDAAVVFFCAARILRLDGPAVVVADWRRVRTLLHVLSMVVEKEDLPPLETYRPLPVWRIAPRLKTVADVLEALGLSGHPRPKKPVRHTAEVANRSDPFDVLFESDDQDSSEDSPELASLVSELKRKRPHEQFLERDPQDYGFQGDLVEALDELTRTRQDDQAGYALGEWLDKTSTPEELELVRDLLYDD
jgi:hypothetical protein